MACPGVFPCLRRSFASARQIVNGKYEPTEAECEWASDDEDDEDNFDEDDEEVDEAAHEAKVAERKAAKAKAQAEAAAQAKADGVPPAVGIPHFWATVLQNYPLTSEVFYCYYYYFFFFSVGSPVGAVDD